MIRRARGLAIIIRTLFPVLVVVAIALATWLAARAVVEATTTYGENLATRLDGVREAVDEANDGFQAVGEFVGATVAASDALLERVAGLRDSVDIALPEVAIPEFTIPLVDYTVSLPEFRLGDGDLTIPIPGIGPIKDLATDLADAGRRAADPLVKVTALADVPPELEAAAQDTVIYAADVRSSVGTWLKVVLVILLMAAVVWVISQAQPMFSELGRGWAMVIGRPDPGRAVVDLAGRVRELERQVAALR